MEKYSWYNNLTERFMKEGYFHNSSTIEDRVQSISDGVRKYFGDTVANKVKEYIELGYYVLPTPVWSNFGTERGSGISCFNTYVGDSVKSILTGVAEVGMLSKIGGGTSGYFGHVRPKGSKVSTGGEADGPMGYLEMFDVVKRQVNQGSQRRGEFSPYLDVEHADILEYLEINREGSKFQRLPYGVCISDKWIEDMQNGNKKNRKIWLKILENRQYTGFPYIFFTDNVNNNTVDVYKDNNMKIYGSNMCTEILLPSNDEESFVCDLVGMNLVEYDNWKNTDAVKMAVYLADAVLQDFIDKNKNNVLVERAVRFAERHRAIAIGASGYHTYLQERMIPFESIQARAINREIFREIQGASYAASQTMFMEYGASDLMTPYKRRHSCLNAIAPNTSSSFIMKQHFQSIEPGVSNYYLKKLNKIKTAIKNPTLEKLLEEKGNNTTAIWDDILRHEGSVQHLDILTQDEKEVFKTFSEISQLEIIQQAADRQKYIDQGQSLNIMLHPDTPIKDVHKLYLTAHELGIKTLYYQLTISAAQEFNKSLLECSLCSG